MKVIPTVEKKLILQYLDACNLACRHCIVSSAPGLKPKLPLEKSKEIMREASLSGYQELVLTGGEPFLLYGMLRDLIEEAKRLGQKASVTSNAFWANSVDEAERKLLPLKQAGLDKIHLSYDRPHQEEGIPFAYIENAMEAAKRVGLPFAVWLVFLRDDAEVFDLKGRLESEGIEVRFSGVIAMGRGRSLAAEEVPRYDAACLGHGCATFGFLVITPRGDVYACCNSAPEASRENPLSLGNVFEMPFREILHKKNKLLLHELISRFGPRYLYKLLPKPMQKDIDGELHPCQFCTRMLNDPEKADYLLRHLVREDRRVGVKLTLLELLKNKSGDRQEAPPSEDIN